MREIKCRGYNKELQKWIIGSYVDGYIINGVMESNEEYIVIERWAPVEKGSVGQYTGLRDGSGVNIYEKDIAMDKDGLIWEVVFERGRFGLIGLGSRFIRDDIIIMGNTWENPELLEED